MHLTISFSSPASPNNRRYVLQVTAAPRCLGSFNGNFQIGRKYEMRSKRLVSNEINQCNFKTIVGESDFFTKRTKWVYFWKGNIMAEDVRRQGILMLFQWYPDVVFFCCRLDGFRRHRTDFLSADDGCQQIWDNWLTQNLLGRLV